MGDMCGIFGWISISIENTIINSIKEKTKFNTLFWSILALAVWCRLCLEGAFSFLKNYE